MHHPAADVAAAHGGEGVVHGTRAREARDTISEDDHTFKSAAREELNTKGPHLEHSLKGDVTPTTTSITPTITM